MTSLLHLADRKSLLLVRTLSSTPTLRASLDSLSRSTSEIKTYLTQIRQAYDCFALEPLLAPLQQLSPTFLAVRFIKGLAKLIRAEEERMDELDAAADDAPMIDKGGAWEWSCMEQVRRESQDMMGCFLSIAGLLPSGGEYGVKERLSDIALFPGGVMNFQFGGAEFHDGHTEMDPEEGSEEVVEKKEEVVNGMKGVKRMATRSSTAGGEEEGRGKRLRRS
ncbi:hypothetical protein BJ508DRAFT_412573 [Ascobolus immersus RN42]|uniref:Uncharacterized protein n=1 Tax=Ascobolus immersus RN42 TaxID=1160509 RepID=A0A3N4IFD5_ASCIM|nr:hypothetical protein BJ508DRAFT_412573 [Ascobolus immersus RN42]